MAYQIEKTYTSFWGGISDDDFLGTENSVKNMYSIDVQTQERYAQAEWQYTTIADYSLAGGASWAKETPYSIFVSNITTVQRSGSTVSLPSSAFAVESYWTGTDQVNYFFLSDRIRKMNADWSAQIGTDITTNYPAVTYQIVTGWHVTNLLFSKWDKIYFVDTVNDAITVTSGTATQLMKWSTVKCIYSYSYDSIVVVATNNGNTQIYELEFTWWAYNIVRKIEIVGYECTHAVGNSFDVFWKSYEGIHQYQGGQSIFIKKLEESIDSMSYNKQLIIATSNDVYTFGAKKPWRNKILTRVRRTDTTSFTIATSNYIITNVSWGYNIRRKWSAYSRTNTIELLALDGGIHQIPKQDLSFRFGYIFDRNTYVDTTSPVRQAIVVKIKIDAMTWIAVEVARVTDWDTLDSIGNKRYWYMEITPDMVVNALTTAWVTTEFWYVEVTIELLAGDEVSTAPWLYRKTPQLFDFTSRANFVKNV